MHDAMRIAERIEAKIRLDIAPDRLTASVEAISLDRTPTIVVMLTVPWGVLEPRRIILEQYKVTESVGKEQREAALWEYFVTEKYNPLALLILEKMKQLVRGCNYQNFRTVILFDYKREDSELGQIKRLLDAGERVLQIGTVDN